MVEGKKAQDDAASISSLKPFRLVKFFSYTGFAVFLLFTLVLSWIISNHAKKVLLERSEAYAFVVAASAAPEKGGSNTARPWPATTIPLSVPPAPC